MTAGQFQPAVVACLDIGSPKKGNVGWAVLCGSSQRTGRDLWQFIEALVAHLSEKRSVAIGFECPLYVPKRSDVDAMTDCRLGEAGLNWCGGPGASVLATGLAQVNWVATQLVQRVPGVAGTTRWPEFASGLCQMFFWEAFITSLAGVVVEIDAADDVTPHEQDALCGALAFRNVKVTASDFPSDLHDEPALSLIGLHLVESGLSQDVSLLSERCAVLKVRKPQ